MTKKDRGDVEQVIVLKTDVKHNGIFYPEGTALAGNHIHFAALQHIAAEAPILHGVYVFQNNEVPVQTKHTGGVRPALFRGEPRINSVEQENVVEVEAKKTAATFEKPAKQTHTKAHDEDESPENTDTAEVETTNDSDDGQAVVSPDKQFVPEKENLTVKSIKAELDKLEVTYDARANKDALYDLLVLELQTRGVGFGA